MKSTEDQVIIRLNGKSGLFRCDCGCNVFTRIAKLKYQCNSCRSIWEGEEEEDG